MRLWKRYFPIRTEDKEFPLLLALVINYPHQLNDYDDDNEVTNAWSLKPHLSLFSVFPSFVILYFLFFFQGPLSIIQHTGSEPMNRTAQCLICFSFPPKCRSY